MSRRAPPASRCPPSPPSAPAVRFSLPYLSLTYDSRVRLRRRTTTENQFTLKRNRISKKWLPHPSYRHDRPHSIWSRAEPHLKFVGHYNSYSTSPHVSGVTVACGCRTQDHTELAEHSHLHVPLLAPPSQRFHVVSPTVSHFLTPETSRGINVDRMTTTCHFIDFISSWYASSYIAAAAAAASVTQ